jgi:hypothetical protein
MNTRDAFSSANTQIANPMTNNIAIFGRFPIIEKNVLTVEELPIVENICIIEKIPKIKNVQMVQKILITKNVPMV